MSTTLLFRGAKADLGGKVLDAGPFSDIIDVQLAEEYRLGEVRGASQVDVELEDNTVTELALEGGIHLWLSGATLRELFESTGQQESRDGELLVTPVLPIGTPSRGVGRWTIHTIRKLAVGKIAEKGATAVAERLEQRLLETGGSQGAGLYRCESPSLFAEAVEELPDGGPNLLLLHGTGSSYDGSFGRLPLAQWDRLQRRYGNRIFAYQHPTLSRSPVANALDLLERVPKGTTLHLVSHSRGGLIGEILCRGSRAAGAPFDELEVGHFRKAAAKTRGARAAAYKQEADNLEKLSELLAERDLKVERFVRVACPANGTTLASRRLDLYFSVVLNGLRAVLPAHPVTGFLGALIPALIKERANPDTLPGLEAMMPESPLVAVLNRRDVEVTADLSVIAGDMEGGTTLGRLKELVSDLFYRENHDLVVHTRAMVGGTPRADGKARLHFAKGSEVDHFRYFATEATAEKVLFGLLRADGSDAGFEPIKASTAEELRRRDAAETRGPHPITRTRPLVFLLPGIMGSHLRTDKKRIWVHLLNLAGGDFKKLDITAADIQPDALVGRSYDRLSRFLETSHDVIDFPYDWRRTIPETADLFAQHVERALVDTKQPVRFLAHSMGGLVARTMIARHPELWRRVVSREGGRLIMLGTPNRGSWAVPRVLLGHDRLVKMLSIVDLRSDERKLLGTIAAFNGLVEMLPHDEEHDFFTEEAWRALAIDAQRPNALPAAAVLAKAREVRRVLEGSEAVDPEHMVYVAGIAPATVTRYRTRGSRVEFLATSQGDGTVPWSLGLLDGVPTYYMEAKHGDMANVPRWFPAIRELLEQGTTAQLSQQPPAAVRAAVREFVLPEDEIVAFPEQDVLEAVAVMGEIGTTTETETLEPLSVTICHGNLAFSPGPVMAGHYDGDTIAGAEKVLDGLFDGWLTEHMQLELYPGPIDTASVFLRGDDSEPCGAIVIGLGDVGSLTPGRLERAVLRGTLAFAAKLLEREVERGSSSGPVQAGIAALLIGSGRGGMPVEDSLRAVVAGVVAARERLRAVERHQRVNIRELRFLELYEDVALQAARTLRRLESDTRFEGQIAAHPEVLTMPGRRRRARYTEESRWWTRLQVTEKLEDGTLEFRNLTQRARTEQFLEPTQKQLIERFVREAISSPRPDPTTAGTLFELLVPNALKEYAPDQNDLVLVVDEASARYPWELMADRRSGEGMPIAVRTGLLRSLSVDTFRARPNAVLGNHALVVGDPPSELPELPGAQQEAEAVASLMAREGLSVNKLMRPSAQAVVGQLFARDYKILHFAAHGVHDQEVVVREARHAEDKPVTKRVSGMVIGFDGVLLTPAEVEKMRAVPELVFINCCHLGRTVTNDKEEEEQRRRRHRLAANIAAQFIRMGVRAVVAAGWAVDDAAAVTFATTFYQELLSGRPFGDTVKAARERTYNEHMNVNTWGAYQCYGDPGYILRVATEAYGGPQTEESFASTSELTIQLENIAQDAETTSQRDASAEQERVRSMKKWVASQRPDWLEQAQVLTAFARTFRELDCFEDAIGCYEKALKTSITVVSIQDLEQLSNLRSRLASMNYTRSSRAATERAEATKMIRQAIRELQGLPPVITSDAKIVGEGLTSERLSLYGSAQKRLSLVLQGEEWLNALREMMQYYQLADRAANGLNTYPALNWLCACAVLHQLGELDAAKTPNWDDEAERIRAVALKSDEKSADFWQLAARAETELIQGIASGKLDSAIGSVAEGYLRAWRRGGTPRKLRSVLEHMDWLIDTLSKSRERVASGGAAAATGVQLAEALSQIRGRLEVLLEVRGVK